MRRCTGVPVTIQFAPTAPFADLLALYPYPEGTPGTSLFGAADAPLVLMAANGVRLTFAAAAIVQMPDLTLTSRGAVAGTVTFLALGARALPVTAANRLVTIDTADVPRGFRPRRRSWRMISRSRGARAVAGVAGAGRREVQFAMKTRPVFSAANALLDLTLESLAVTASFTPGTPAGPVEADVFAALQVQGRARCRGGCFSGAADAGRRGRACVAAVAAGAD